MIRLCALHEHVSGHPPLVGECQGRFRTFFSTAAGTDVAACIVLGANMVSMEIMQCMHGTMARVKCWRRMRRHNGWHSFLALEFDAGPSMSSANLCAQDHGKKHETMGVQNLLHASKAPLTHLGHEADVVRASTFHCPLRHVNSGLGTHGLETAAARDMGVRRPED